VISDDDTESSRLERPNKIIKSSHQPMPVTALDNVTQQNVGPILENLQGRYSTTSLRSLFQYFTTVLLCTKKLFLISNLNLPCLKAITSHPVKH